jgi:hypothetical protein
MCSHLKSWWSSESSPHGDCNCSSSSSPELRSTTMRFFLGWSSLARAVCLVFWRCFECLSAWTSSSVAVYSASRSELGDPLCMGGDLTLFSLDPVRLGILLRGWRQETNGSPFTCKHHLWNIIRYHKAQFGIASKSPPMKTHQPCNQVNCNHRRCYNTSLGAEGADAPSQLPHSAFTSQATSQSPVAAALLLLERRPGQHGLAGHKRPAAKC